MTRAVQIARADRGHGHAVAAKRWIDRSLERERLYCRRGVAPSSADPTAAVGAFLLLTTA
eukprot:CAMPEP_0119181338 /NCGR_PEP_ID=MMETSP1315-20130426/59182_1 /TAXON_ID=676789 /ORGANISM="Prasinoderma singularis, Strain RCC927" /LENGTH=59 /DNA_ID=CAMNT_0007175651 /DNA_START=188 /DNA_END=363 /DNA_ORIENTATION=+